MRRGEWVYHNEDRAPVLRVQRFETAEGKTFRQSRWNGDGWEPGVPPGPRPLYRLPQLLAGPEAPVLVVEGEKAADAAAELLPDFVVTTWPGGANAPHLADWSPLRGRKVTVWPDHDEPGKKAGEEVARLALGAGAASVRIVEVPAGFPVGWDPADALENGYGQACLRVLLEGARAFALPPPTPTLAHLPEGTPLSDVEAVLRRQAAEWASLDALGREIAREEALSHLRRIGVSAPARLLDAAIPQLESGDGDSLQGGEVTFPDPEPWPQPVDGAKLLEELASYFRCFAVLPEGGAEALATWTLFTHTADAFDVAPLLVLLSPEKRCGKSTVLSCLGRVVARPLSTSNVTAAVLFRVVEACLPTLLIDEADSFARDDEGLRGILDSGHTRDLAFVLRCEGDDHEPRKFSTWGPKALAAIGRVPGTVEDRAINLPMKRKTRAERTERARRRILDAAARDLSRKCARWAADHQEALRGAAPQIPEALNDRAADNWEPLLAIADAAGGEWPVRLRAAAAALAGGTDQDSGTAGVMLLADLRAYFEGGGEDRAPSAALVDHLVGLEGRPWAEWRRGRPLTPHGLARLLRPYGVIPHTIRTEAGTAKGYLVGAFKDAFDRYLAPLPPDPPSATVTPSQPAPDVASSDFSSRNTEKPVTVEKSPETRAQPALWRCDGSDRGDGAGEGGGTAPGAPPAPCRACRGTRFWRHEGGGPPVCGRCHPPADPARVSGWLEAAT